MIRLRLAKSDGAVIVLDQSTVEMSASSLRGKLIRAVDPGGHESGDAEIGDAEDMLIRSTPLVT
jgi:hypothetical protein